MPYTPETSTGWHSEYMAEDQRFAGRRPDVLEYRSAPLEEDLTLAGPLAAELWVSTTGSDADWVVKLIDEYPERLPGYDKDSEDPDLGGTQQMVRSETLRGRYRNSLSKPEPFEPGKITPVTVDLQDVLHTFKRGHRIMIQIQSSLFPFIDRNPQQVRTHQAQKGIQNHKNEYQDQRNLERFQIVQQTDKSLPGVFGLFNFSRISGSPAAPYPSAWCAFIFCWWLL